MDIDRICQSQEIDEEGIYPQPGASENGLGELSLYALAIPPAQIIEMAFDFFCRDLEVVEFFVSLDTFTRSGQGTELDSALNIFHVKRGEPARVGVMEYSWQKGQPITKPICWENKFWQSTYSDLLKALTAAGTENWKLIVDN